MSCAHHPHQATACNSRACGKTRLLAILNPDSMACPTPGHEDQITQALGHTHTGNIPTTRKRSVMVFLEQGKGRAGTHLHGR